MSSRKPHCRSCGLPMKGHRQCRQAPLVPTNSPQLVPLPSPREVSPQRHATPLSEVVIPTSGIYRRPNPNWVDRPRAFPSPRRAASLVPTEPVEQQWAVKSEGGRSKLSRSMSPPHEIEYCGSDDGASRSSGSLMESMLQTSEPLASLFRTPRQDVSRVKDAAEEVGLHVGLMRKPPSTSQRKSNRMAEATKPLQRENSSLYMVLGRSKDAVGYLLDMQQRAMPGAIEPEFERWGSGGFLQLVFAGIVGGVVVLYGLSLL